MPVIIEPLADRRGAAGSAAAAVLRGEQLVLRYGKTAVVHGVSVVLAPGRVTALVGPNGSGKSTLLVCVADALGRTLIAPSQIPAGLMMALVGAPYFVWLLRRSRL
ncbi:iron chelate uptake ABC transporter family permease subunit [Micromonospora rubida]